MTRREHIYTITLKGYWIKPICYILSVVLLIAVMYYFGFFKFLREFEFTAFFFPDTDSPNGEFLKIGLQMAGGLAVIYGLYLNNKRAKAMIQNNEHLGKGNTDARFKDAVEQLGSENTPVVLGSIYVLDQIAQENERYEKAVFDILCGYLRHKTTPSEYADRCEKEQIGAVEVQTIVDLLFRSQSKIYGQFTANLIRVNFSGMELTDADFRGAKMIEAVFIDSDLTGAIFESCDLDSAVFTESLVRHVSFKGANLIECDFTAAELNNTDFRGVLMEAANFKEAELYDIIYDTDRPWSATTMPNGEVYTKSNSPEKYV